jgi:para-nitrobenzyl esterase
MYQLDFGSPIDRRQDGRLPQLRHRPGVRQLAAPGSKTGTGPDARAVANQMSEAFIALARTGDPNCAAIPAWEKYTLPKRATLVFDVASKMVDDPRGRSGSCSRWRRS